MEMSKKQVEFWVALLVLCLITAIAITLVDFSIKASILEESLRLREVIEGESVKRGPKPAPANTDGASNLRDNDVPIPGHLLVDNATGMETGNDRNGDSESGTNTSKRRAQPSRPTRTRKIQGGDK